jgi:hypothetical protein
VGSRASLDVLEKRDGLHKIMKHHWLFFRDRKQMNIFERKVYRRILGPVYGNEKENRKILTNKEIYAMVKKPTTTETIRLNRLSWFGMFREWKKVYFSKNYYLYIWKQ